MTDHSKGGDEPCSSFSHMKGHSKGGDEPCSISLPMKGHSTGGDEPCSSSSHMKGLSKGGDEPCSCSSHMKGHSKGGDEPCSSSSHASTCDKLCCKCIRPCIAELVATMLFVFTGVLSSCHTTSWFSAGFTHGLILFVLVAATLYVSGGHINPAVTLALTICRGLQPILAPLYVLAQLLGAIIGAGLAKAVMTSDSYNLIEGGVHNIGPGIDPGQAILAEMIATSILVLAVLMVAFDERNKSVLAPLAIGLSVAGGIFAIGQISGASMNPARSFGPAVVKGYWKKHYVYWVGPILGSVFSALLYSLVLGTPSKLWIPCHEPQ